MENKSVVYPDFICAAAIFAWKNRPSEMYVGEFHGKICERVRNANPAEYSEYICDTGFLDTTGEYVERSVAWYKNFGRNLGDDRCVPTKSLDLVQGQKFADAYNAKSIVNYAPKQKKLSEFGEIYNFVQGTQVREDKE